MLTFVTTRPVKTGQPHIFNEQTVNIQLFRVLLQLMINKALLGTLFLIFIHLSGTAQILNVEKFRSTLDTSKAFIASFAGGYELKQKGNKSQTINTALNSAFLSKKHTYLFIGRFQSTKINNSDIFNMGHLHFRMELFRQNPRILEPYIQSQFDLSKGLKRRHLTGVNVRQRIYTDSILVVYGATGVFYENENWIGNNKEEIQNINLKSNTYLSFRLNMSKKIKLFVTSYYQSAFTDFKKPRLILDSNLQIAFDKKLSFDINYEMQLDKKPLTSLAKLTYQFNTGLRYNF